MQPGVAALIVLSEPDNDEARQVFLDALMRNPEFRAKCEDMGRLDQDQRDLRKAKFRYVFSKLSYVSAAEAHYNMSVPVVDSADPENNEFSWLPLTINTGLDATHRLWRVGLCRGRSSHISDGEMRNDFASVVIGLEHFFGVRGMVVSTDSSSVVQMSNYISRTLKEGLQKYVGTTNVAQTRQRVQSDVEGWLQQILNSQSSLLTRYETTWDPKDPNVLKVVMSVTQTPTEFDVSIDLRIE